ncbi:unnamed protein product [Meganyctiphanes norvegica]|uniref:RGS domain-containing protein n=1 Tax=Meganyctiphanes norvegica TaxID=48144 RepID=A0AAV2Q4M3_MEGNR
MGQGSSLDLSKKRKIYEKEEKNDRGFEKTVVLPVVGATKVSTVGATNVSSVSATKVSTTIDMSSDKPKNPTKKQLEKWLSSINALLIDPEGFRYFEYFLKEAETDDGELTRYLEFWQQCQEYKERFQSLEDTAMNIFETFLEVGAEKEIGTAGKGEEVGEKLEDEGLPGKSLFDDAQENVKKKLADGQYANFCDHLKEKFNL